MNHREFLYGNKPFAFLPFDIHTGTNKNVKENKEKRGKDMREEAEFTSLFDHTVLDIAGKLSHINKECAVTPQSHFGESRETLEITVPSF